MTTTTQTNQQTADDLRTLADMLEKGGTRAEMQQMALGIMGSALDVVGVVQDAPSWGLESLAYKQAFLAKFSL